MGYLCTKIMYVCTKYTIDCFNSSLLMSLLTDRASSRGPLLWASSSFPITAPINIGALINTNTILGVPYYTYSTMRPPKPILII